MPVVVDNHTIDYSPGPHGWDVTKGGPYKKMTSNRRAAPSDPRAAVPMPQEKAVRIEHEQGPLLPVARVHARAPGAHSLGGMAKVGVSKSEIKVNSCETRMRNVRNSSEFARIHMLARPQASQV